jgi:hypothetical protein
MAMKFQSPVTAKKAITLLLKEVISIRFDQNLFQGENCPTEGRIRRNREEERIQQKNTEEYRRLEASARSGQQ